MKLFYHALLTGIFLIAGCSVSVAGSSDSDSPDFMALPIMMYTTDTGFGGGLAGFKTYYPERERTSNIQAMFLYTEKKQIQTAIQWDHYFADNRNRLTVKNSYGKFPTSLFGMGNNTQNDDPANFTPEYFNLEILMERRILRSFRIKPSLFFWNQSLDSFEAGSTVTMSGIPWIRGRLDAGAGLSFVWDTRDNLFATKSGSFLQFTVDGSLYQDDGRAFNRIELDARRFFCPFPEIVLASMFLVQDTRGDVPLYFLSQLGGSDRLRGYEYDRFRDRSLILLQQDIRFPIWWRFDGAVFASAGRVADNIGSLAEGKWHSAAGAGLRFYMNREENLLIRADYARGSDAFGIYFMFAEAF